MRKLALVTAMSAAYLSLAACGDGRDEAANDGSMTVDPTADGMAGGGVETTAAAFPPGSRIIEEGGITFRIDPDGTRIRLGPTDSRIVVEDDVRFRVDPDGTRVRIDPEGAQISVGDDDVQADIGLDDDPTVEVTTNGVE